MLIQEPSASKRLDDMSITPPPFDGATSRISRNLRGFFAYGYQSGDGTYYMDVCADSYQGGEHIFYSMMPLMIPPSGSGEVYLTRVRDADIDASDGYSIIFGCYGNAFLPAPGNLEGAYVFVWDGRRRLIHQGTLKPSDEEAGDFGFGCSVSIDGDTAIVGASSHDEYGTNAGMAYVYVRSGGEWSQQQRIHQDDGYSFFGGKVCVSGDTAVITAVDHALVYVRTGSVWSRQAVLQGDSYAQDFGVSTSIDGDTIAVGDNGIDDPNTDCGSVYIFTRVDSIWSQQARLVGDGYVGANLGVGGVTLVDDGNTLIASGGAMSSVYPNERVYIFKRTNGSWSIHQRLLPDSGDEFGVAVDMSDNAVIIIQEPLTEHILFYEKGVDGYFSEIRDLESGGTSWSTVWAAVG